MIKFFRKIRYDLMGKNITRQNDSVSRAGKPAWPIGRYLKYAIGEILLVVIGILIALQINNWNEKRKNDKIKQLYIANLKIDLTNYIKNLETLDSLNTFYETEGSYLDEYLNGKLNEIDTVRLTNAIVIVAYIPNMTLLYHRHTTTS